MKLLNIFIVERLNAKWMFRGYSDVDVKVVLALELLVGTGPLPDWLRNLARGRMSKMMALDTFKDNLCLLHCIAVHNSARPDRSRQVAREPAKRFHTLKATPKGIRNRRSMSWIMLKGILIERNVCQNRLASWDTNRSVRLAESSCDLLKGIHQISFTMGFTMSTHFLIKIPKSL